MQGDPASHKQGFLLDLFRADTAQRPRHELELPLLFAKGVAPLIKGGYSDFPGRLNAFSGGLLESLKEIPGLVVAGGAVVGALTNTEKGDLDIFLALPAEEAEQSLRKVFVAVQANRTSTSTSNSEHLHLCFRPSSRV